MEIKTYLDEVESAASLARKMSIAPELISQWKTGKRPIPVERCYPIELATGGLVTRRELRPSDWQMIWPELKEAA